MSYVVNEENNTVKENLAHRISKECLVAISETLKN